MNPDNILILPGWLSSGPDHWQSRWERDHGYTRVEQHDWQRPLRGDWIARLEEVLLGCTEPAVLVAHSLGCLTVAAWAVHSQNTHLVKAALLVAPPDTAREDIAQTLPGWAVDQLPLQKLPFTTVVFASSNDPFCALDRAEQFAQAWGSAFQSVGARGHINADSGLGDWLDAHAQLQQLIATAHAAPDENLLGKSQGYPTGNAITWASNPNRVGSWSALHTVPGIQSRKVARATAVRPLASAVQPAPIAYRYRNTDYTLADYLQRQRATGLLVLKNGEIAAEHYRYGRKDDARFLSFSLSKSITALLVGAALARGSIASLDDTAETYAKTLAGSPYGATTLRHLLRMGSGLTFGERYDGSDDIARLSRASAGEPGAGTPAEVLRSITSRHSPAGQKFVYASAETDVLGRVLAEATGKNLAELTHDWLWQPLGAEHDAYWRIGADGQEQAYGAFSASLRDWARVGLLIANDGKVGAQQIVAREYLLDATDPNRQPAAFRPGVATEYFGYGYQFWLLPMKERTLAMQGMHGQTIYVQPASGIVMVLTSVWEFASDKQDPQPYQERDALWRGALRSLGGSTAK